METIEILDVTVIEPRLKHPTIFERFDSLAAGEAFIIHNDHDPKPLYYQLLGERGNTFTWEYVEEGPEVWEVKISKTKADASSPRIGEVVAEDYRKAEVFKKFGLDFCCGGKKTIEKACREKNIDLAEVEQALKEVGQGTQSPSGDYNKWELGFLSDYIINTHHRYIAEAVPVIYEYTQKVARVHGEKHPEAVQIAQHFIDVANELEQHMRKEEQILFPYIKGMAEVKKNGTPFTQPPFGSITNPIQMMEQEHDSAGNVLKEIERLSNNFTPPEDACTTFRLSYAKLKEFWEDLQVHIHLENNVLFPKAVEMERELL